MAFVLIGPVPVTFKVTLKLNFKCPSNFLSSFLSK